MRASWASNAVVCVIMVAATLAAYWSVFSAGFIAIDDAEYVYRNQQVPEGLSWTGWCYAWTTLDCSNWHPVTWLSLELDGSFWKRNPAGFHATNLMIHLTNCVMLFLVLLQMTNGFYRSACVAGLFALHPLHVESVAWVAERKDVLSTFFLLLTVAAYVRYAARPSWLRYLAVVVLFVLGLLAKPMLVTLPILMLLLDGWPLNRIEWSHSTASASGCPRQSFRRLLIEKVPLLVFAFADGIMTIVAQLGAVKIMTDVTFDTRVANMFHAYCWYLQKTFVPTGLTIFYPHPERNLSWWLVGMGMLVFGLISMWTYAQRKAKPYLLFGWAWFVISLLPVIGLVQVGMQAYADRYAYIPHIGLFIAIVWEIHALLAGTKVGRIGGCLVALAACVACGLLTHAQAGYWKNDELLWGHAVEVNPQNGFAHAHLSDVRIKAGDHEQAIFHIESALRSKRFGIAANAYGNWGRSLVALDRPAEAEEKFLAALKYDPNHEVSLDELMRMYQKQGRHREAAQVAARQASVFGTQVEQQPETAASHFRLGYLLAQKGNTKDAVSHFERAVQLAPESAEARVNLAMGQIQLKRREDAKANLMKAIELNPDLAVAHFALADFLESEKDFSGAKTHFAEVLRIKPDDVKAKQRLERLGNP